MRGVTQGSYRKTTSHFNRSRRQEEGGTPLNTLRDEAEREGGQVIKALERKSSEVLEGKGFTEDGVPTGECAIIKDVQNIQPYAVTPEEVKKALVSVEEAMHKRGMAEELVREVSQSSIVANYEQRGDTTNVSMDDVGVKEQKEERVIKEVAETEKQAENVQASEQVSQPEGNKRATVQNTVAHIEQEGKCFTLTGSSILQVLRFILAFLLNNNLICRRLRFFTDGQRCLQTAIIAFFSWHPAVSLILDWFHLVKKFKEELSLACRGREIRNRHLRSLLCLLWFGLLDRAQDYLRTIPSSDLKNTAPIERLIKYLERNRQWIPCYAMRSQLGLPNSSNPVERTNNLVTSTRQKHTG